MEELRDIVRTAEAVSEETGNEAMMDRFRMPGGRGDEELKARARGMAAAIRDLSLNDEFEGHGHGEEETGSGCNWLTKCSEETGSGCNWLTKCSQSCVRGIGFLQKVFQVFRHLLDRRLSIKTPQRRVHVRRRIRLHFHLWPPQAVVFKLCASAGMRAA